MITFVILENNEVVNRVISDKALAENWIESDTANIGDKYINSVFVTPDITSVTPIVPDVVFMRQARLALLEEGLLDNVEAVLNSLPEPFKSEAKIEWEYATEVRRDWPTLNQIAEYLELTEDYIDDLFILAASK